MTFACRTFQGAGGLSGATQNPNATLANVSAISGLRTAQMTLNATGTTSYIGGTSTGGNWFTVIDPANGASYWVKLHVTSITTTTITGSALDTVLSLATDRNWSFRNTAAGDHGTGSFTLTFYSDAGGTQVVGTYTGQTWDVGFSP